VRLQPFQEECVAKQIVRMLKRYGSHNPGEVCGFERFYATALVLRGLAAWATPGQEAGSQGLTLPPHNTVKVAGRDVPVAPNIAEDAAHLRAQMKE
jgi:hypothetical protein